MTDEELERLLSAVHERNVKAAPAQHPVWTPEKILEYHQKSAQSRVVFSSVSLANKGELSKDSPDKRLKANVVQNGRHLALEVQTPHATLNSRLVRYRIIPNRGPSITRYAGFRRDLTGWHRSSVELPLAELPEATGQIIADVEVELLGVQPLPRWQHQDLLAWVAQSLGRPEEFANKLRSVTEQGKQLAAKAKKAAAALEKAQAECRLAATSAAQAKGRLAEAQKEVAGLSTLAGENHCRHCGQEVTPEHLKMEKVRREKLRVSAETAHRTAEQDHKKATEETANANARHNNLQRELAEARGRFKDLGLVRNLSREAEHDALEVVRVLGAAAATPDFLGRLVELLSAPFWDVQRVPVEVMAVLGAAAATPDFLACMAQSLRDSSSDVRRAASMTVRALGAAAATPEFLARLAELLEDPSWEVQSEAVELVRVLGAAAGPPTS
jgi:hypothetical protein